MPNRGVCIDEESISVPAFRSDRDVFLYDEIALENVTEVTSRIMSIEVSDSETVKALNQLGVVEVVVPPINLYINTRGGDANACLGLYDYVVACKSPVHTIVLGVAASAGMIIFLAGKRRFAYKHSSFMWHNVQNTFSGSTKDMEEDLLVTKQLNQMMDNIVLEKTKIKRQKLTSMTNKKQDWWMFAEEALKYGVVEEIL